MTASQGVPARPATSREGWENMSTQDADLSPVTERIKRLRELGLISIMVVAYFIHRRLAPLGSMVRCGNILKLKISARRALGP